MGCRIIQADCREVLKDLPADSIHVCVTSPPYWSLRSYLPDEHPDKRWEIGLEPTLGEYVAALVSVFQEVRRVLHPLGTLWLNLGDCYAGSTGLQRYSPERDNRNGLSNTGNTSRGEQKFTRNVSEVAPVFRDYGSLKPKDLCGVPWRVALALQDAGWWLRSDFDHHALLEPVGEDSLEEGRRLAKRGKKVRRYRARRTVWDVVVGCYPGAHTAVMPEELARLCIAAGTSPEGCCRRCLKPFDRLTKDREDEDGFLEWETIGWGGCSCPPIDQIENGRCVVLDPFGGTGTTGAMATKLGHDSIVIELNPETIEQAEARNRQGGLGL